MNLNIYCDGGARGNPGPAAGAFVVKEEAPHFAKARGEGNLRGKSGKFLGTTTNNVAEYQAVIEALKWIKDEIKDKRYEIKERRLVHENEKMEIHFFLDSNLVVNQLNGRFKVKNSDLRDLLFKVRELEQSIRALAMEQFNNLTIIYSYIPREQNWEADQLVNETLDAVQ